YAWCLRRDAEYEMRDAEAPDATRAAHPPSRIPHPDRPGVAAYVGLMLLVLQVGLGAVTVKLSLPPWTVILHLGTAMLLLATLLVAARPANLTPGASPGITEPPITPGSRPGLVG